MLQLLLHTLAERVYKVAHDFFFVPRSKEKKCALRVADDAARGRPVHERPQSEKYSSHLP